MMVSLKKGILTFFPLVIVLTFCNGQPFTTAQTWIEQLDLNGNFPDNLLSTRTTAFYSPSFSQKELDEAQSYFQRAGIDAVAYFTIDMLTAGTDVSKAFHNFLTKREVSNLVFLEKNEGQFRISITSFNEKETIIEPNQKAWSVTNKAWTEALKILHRSTSTQLKKQNLLINDAPELGLTINPILGKRNEFYAVDLKVDPLAVPMFGDEAIDKELEALFVANYPYKYKLMEPGTTEKEMRKQGYLYVVYFIHTRGSVAKELLGYNLSNSESALVSITFPEGPRQSQLKNISASTPVFKVYFKHIDSGNIFLGNKWDADVTWQQALLNNIRGMKAELRIE